jgi:hypothetical protein
VQILWNSQGEDDLKLEPIEGKNLIMSEFRIQELIACLYQLTIISLPKNRRK